MKRGILIMIFTLILACTISSVSAQCSICTKTAQQLGETTGRGLNKGILYLAAVPFLIVGFIGYRWWKNDSGHRDDQ